MDIFTAREPSTAFKFTPDKTVISVGNLIQATRYVGSVKWTIEPLFTPEGDDIPVTADVVQTLATAMFVADLFEGEDA